MVYISGSYLARIGNGSQHENLSGGINTVLNSVNHTVTVNDWHPDRAGIIDRYLSQSGFELAETSSYDRRITPSDLGNPDSTDCFDDVNRIILSAITHTDINYTISRYLGEDGSVAYLIEADDNYKSLGWDALLGATLVADGAAVVDFVEYGAVRDYTMELLSNIPADIPNFLQAGLYIALAFLTAGQLLHRAAGLHDSELVGVPIEPEHIDTEKIGFCDTIPLGTTIAVYAGPGSNESDLKEMKSGIVSALNGNDYKLPAIGHKKASHA